MIYLASDHAGYQLKEDIKDFLGENGIDYIDMGPETYERLDDYPDYIIPAAEKVAENPEEHKGIVFGGSGQGEAVAANKVRGIRAVVYCIRGEMDEEAVRLTREHNDANILSIGAGFVKPEVAKQVVSLWLETPFPGEERHARRIEKIRKYEAE